MKPDDSKLSAKHEAFAVLCSGGMAASTAYARIYPKASKATSLTQGPALLRKPQVEARVADLQATAAKEFTMTRVEWLQSLARLARKAEESGQFVAARGCLREIGLAMPAWYQTEAPHVTTAPCLPEVAEAMKRLFGDYPRR